jgi:AmiR/NasT family two-component response regulator
MTAAHERPLRVLVANEATEPLDRLAEVTASLGHDVVARAADTGQVARAALDLDLDIALIALHDDHTAYALGLIGEIARGRTCPAIAITDGEDREFVHAAAAEGIFAYAASMEPEALESAIDIAMRRFAEAEDLQGAFIRRALIERAKGVLMERHSIDEGEAFEMLRGHARRSGAKVVDVSESVLESHRLLRDNAAG